MTMRPEDLLALTRRAPFAPFRIHMSDGQAYEIRHPDQIIVLRSRAVVGVGHDNGVPERVEHVALLHICRLEEVA